MHKYHGTPLHSDRVLKGICRCGSGARSYDSSEILTDGRVRDPRDGLSMLTSDPIGRGPTRSYMFIYAVNAEHRIRFAPDGNRNAADSVKHETLFTNADVLAAGEIQFTDGVVTDINDLSGSYGTQSVMESDPTFARDLLAALERAGIPVSSVVAARLNSLREIE